jgi:hypothetical protein
MAKLFLIGEARWPEAPRRKGRACGEGLLAPFSPSQRSLQRSPLQHRWEQPRVLVAQRETAGLWGPVSDAIPAVDNGNFGDQNGDGLACHRTNKGQSTKHDLNRGRGRTTRTRLFDLP